MDGRNTITPDFFSAKPRVRQPESARSEIAYSRYFSVYQPVSKTVLNNSNADGEQRPLMSQLALDNPATPIDPLFWLTQPLSKTGCPDKSKRKSRQR